MYKDEEMLMLSGIQHFVYCRRQWALIHIDGYWEDNSLTTQGMLLHSRVDDPKVRQRLNGVDTLRHLSIASRELGLYGVTDAVELITDIEGDCQGIFSGRTLFPVEYKRGHSKPDLCDVMQLTAQAMCLEELYDVKVSKGALFYWETRRREEIEITSELRDEARRISNAMHEVFRKGVLPARDPKKGCKRCSLYDICQPSLTTKGSAGKYLKDILYAENA